ncbi:hypothetical protein GPJ61_16680 [Brevibacillus formosus]|uniref:hypothetical protein n=1 Tax=Brevibacillus formosus TaxID=54913 RepID=UPI002155539D|nr:hypothetical protein [Brevibacillus formosus]MBW5469496.1 hypothetical protein [Brevibacillus formosus]
MALSKYGTNSLAECVDIHLTTFSTEADERSAATSAKNYDISAAYLHQTRKTVPEQYKQANPP